MSETPPLPGTELAEEQITAAATESKARVSAATPVECKTTAPVINSRAVWAEVAAVLAVGVVPHIVNAAAFLAQAPLPLPPFWLDALERMVLNGCQIYVVLYLIGRCGEPWQRFGLNRPSFLDLLIGIGLLLLAESLVPFCRQLEPGNGWPPRGSLYPRPEQWFDRALMVLAYGVTCFAEELVTRAYLVTRSEELLRSKSLAVLFAAVLFAAYHAYQGPAGVVYTMAFGLAYGAVFLAIRRIWPLAIGHAIYDFLVIGT